MEEWGFNPATVNAVMTVIATIAAVAAGVYAARAFSSERESRRLAQASYALSEAEHAARRAKDDEDAEDRRRRQAYLVSAWSAVTSDDPERFVLKVANASKSPIYDVTIGIVKNSHRSAYACWVRVIPPSDAGPHIFHDVRGKAIRAWQGWWNARDVKPAPDVEFTFRDAHGNWWLRCADGQLEAITRDEKWRYGAVSTASPPGTDRWSVAGK